MTRIKRFYVHEPNENFLKYGVSITSEMAFTESLLLRKGHFLSRKRGRLFKKYFFRSLNGAFKPRKKGTFFTFKKSVGGGHRPPLPPPPVPRPLSTTTHNDPTTTHNDPQRSTTTHNDPTTTHYDPQRPTTTHYDPQRPTTTPQRPTTIHYDPQRPTTTHNDPTTTHNDPLRPTTTPQRPTTTPQRPTTTHYDPTTTPQRPTTIPKLPAVAILQTINNISYCLWIHHVFYYCKAFDRNPDLHANRWDLKRGE